MGSVSLMPRFYPSPTRWEAAIFGFFKVHQCPGERVAEALKRLKVSKSTRNGYLRSVKDFAHWMTKHGRAARMPDGLALLGLATVAPHERKIQRRALTDDECAKLMRAPMPRRAWYALALYAGLRRSEINRLNPGDVQGGVVAIWGKSQRAETVPVCDALAAVLEDCPPPYAVPGSSAIWTRRDSGSDDVDFHCLRHTFCSRIADGGAHPKTLQTLARHSTIELTMRFYTHLRMGDDIKAVESLPTFLPTLNAGKAPESPETARRTEAG